MVAGRLAAGLDNEQSWIHNDFPKPPPFSLQADRNNGSKDFSYDLEWHPP